MSARTVDWTATDTALDGGTPRAEGLRERKKRLLRQQLSDTATEMFIERGFDAVRVADVAAACGVSEKTVFNYFSTKESLVLDRWEATMATLRTGLSRLGATPVQATLQILAHELSRMMSWLTAQDDQAQAAAALQRFGDLIRATPSLRAHQRDMTDQLVAVVAETIAARAGMHPEDPEPQIAATALIGLWQIHAQALRKHLNGTRTPTEIQDAVTDDVHRAAKLIDTGLSSLTTDASTKRRARQHAPQ